MNRTAAVTRIKAALGFIQGSQHDDQIVLRLQEAQDDLEQGKTLPKFLIAEDQPLILTIATNAVSLPSGFLREVDDELPRYTPNGEDSPVFIQRKHFIDARNAFEADETGGPKVYVLRKSSLYFFPTADQTYALTWSYYKAADPLTSDIENAWLADRAGKWWLTAEAGLLMARDLRDAGAMQMFTDMANRWRTAVFGEIVAAEDAGGPIAMGESN